MTKVVVLAGEGEYGSDRTMTAYADDLRRELPGVDLDYRTPDVLEDYPTFPKSSFGDLSLLRETDLLVVYTRFRVLPDHEMEELAAYVERRGTVIGLRTSTHAFHYDDSTPWAWWNDGFGREVLGSPWISHHGHSSSTDVSQVPGDKHEILAGIPDRFHVRSWLYRVNLRPDCRPLLHGEPVDPEDTATPSPVAWIREHGRGRVFFTSLGHPDDFDQQPVRTLLLNATRWCLGDPGDQRALTKTHPELDPAAPCGDERCCCHAQPTDVP